MRNHYEILDVSRDASAIEIKAAYRFQLKAFHPDKFSAGSIHAERAQERIHQIVEAHRTLSDAGSRAEYDRFLSNTSSLARKERERPGRALSFSSVLEALKVRFDSFRDTVAHSIWWKTLLWFSMTTAVLILVGIWYLPTKQNPPGLSKKLETALVQNEPAAKAVIRPEPSIAPVPHSSAAGTTAESHVFDLPTIARNARKAVLTIQAHDSKGRTKTGTGFFISDDGRIVTNRHVISDATRAEVRTEDGAIYLIAGALTQSQSFDLAVLKAEAKQVPFLVIQPVTPEIGSRVAIIGSPRALEGSLSEGIVSAIRAEGDGTWIQITAPISPGSSGSPVLDGSGHVIGVATRNSGGRFQNLNFARSSQDLSALIERIPKGAKPRLLSDLPETENTPPSASPPATDQKTYRVAGLPKKTPFLNVRRSPGANFEVVVVLPATGRGITLGPGRVTNGTTVWQEIYLGSFHGWVNAQYLIAETGTP